MSLELSQLIVWVLSFSAVAFIMFFLMKRMRENKKAQKEAMIVYEEKKEKYSYLRPGVFEECPREDITAAALFHCMRKENEDFEHYLEHFNRSERVIYGVYQATSTIDGPNASLHSFFLSPTTKPFVEDIPEIFAEVGSHELSDLMRAARRFAEIIENDEEDDEDDPEMGIYARYNFSDFTNEFVTLVGSTNLADKLIDYVLEHKDDFYDHDIPQEYLDKYEGVEDDERTSDEI